MREIARILLLSLLVGAAFSARADDDEIFITGPGVEPNVVILTDTSGSMDGAIDGVTKIEIARQTVISLMSNVEGVRFGVFAFSDDGGDLVSQIGADDADAIAAVAAMTASGGTPLGRATQDIQDYYLGTYTGNSGADAIGDDDDPEGKGKSPPITYDSPIEHQCQDNYVILVTDGQPTGEAETLVSTVATSLNTTDHVADIDDTQNVIVHTIGFDNTDGVALLTTAATNGGGSYYAATNAAQLEASLIDALSQVVEDSYSFVSPLVPSTTVSGGAQAYVASFEPNPSGPFWPGYLAAYTRNSEGRIPVDGDGVPDVAAQVWEAAALLEARTAASRTIYTVVGTNRVSFATSTATLTDALLGVTGATERTELIDFVRGVDTYDADADGNSSEQREWKLGDIYHSKPVLIFAPPLRSSDPSYQAFKTANAGRTEIVLVGANDGMIHAFRATDGVELWGFVPPSLLGSLELMTGRVGPHYFGVDSAIAVADVKVSGTWKTMAIFGSRRGGSSYTALDITDTTDPVYLWSFTDAEMGETWSTPAIGKILLDDDSEKYVAFVGGGFDSTSNNAAGRAFYAIDLDNGSELWEYSNNGVADAQFMNFSVAAPPRPVDTTGDTYIDRVYVADVGGQIWKFDMSSPTSLSGGKATNWSGKRLFAADPGQANPPAAGAYNPAQGMYEAPALAFDEDGDPWLFIGSGDRNHPKNTSSNMFLGIKDTTDMTNGSTLTKASLVNGTGTSTVVNGWYLDLAGNEKVLARADAFDDIVYFSTYTPGAVTACDAADAAARLYAVQMDNGHAGIDWAGGTARTGTTGTEVRYMDAGTGAPTQPFVVIGATETAVIVGTTDQGVDDQPIPRTEYREIEYWREVF